MAAAFPDPEIPQSKESFIDDTSQYDSEEPEVPRMPQRPLNMKSGAVLLRSWLNKTFHIEMTDGRVLIGVFLCTDRDSNIILGSCAEYLPPDADGMTEDPRMLGLVMIPGRHVVSVHLDTSEQYVPDMSCRLRPGMNVSTDEIM